MIYLDTSAILKFLRPEAETDALAAHLGGYERQSLFTSALATVEVARALTALGSTDLADRAVTSSDRITLRGGTVLAVPVTAPILDLARTLPPAVPRSLDAIHVATAMLARDNLDHLITYDKRMVAAAEAAGVPTAAPS